MRSKALANRIAARVKEKELSFAEFGKLINVPKSTAANYIYGTHQTPFDLLPAIAIALDVSEEWLLGFTENQRETITTGSNWRQKIEKALAEEGIGPSNRQGILDVIRLWLENTSRNS